MFLTFRPKGCLGISGMASVVSWTQSLVFVVTRVSFHAASMLLFYAFSLKRCDFMGWAWLVPAGTWLCPAGGSDLCAIGGGTLWILGSWCSSSTSRNLESACFGLGKDKVIPLCSPQMCVSILDPQVGGGLRAGAAFCGAARLLPRVFAAACAAASGALLFLLVVFVKWWDPLFLVSGMVLLGLFALSSVLYLIVESPLTQQETGKGRDRATQRGRSPVIPHALVRMRMGKAAIGPHAGKRCWPLLAGLWRAIAPLMKPWCAEGSVPTAANHNRYRGWNSCVGWHRDDEPLFGKCGDAKLIVSWQLCSFQMEASVLSGR